VVMHEDSFVLSTDQAELFILEKDTAQATQGRSLFPFTPLLLRQGSLESITYVNGEFWLAGERGEFVRTNLSGDVIGTHPLPEPLNTTDITGLASVDNTMFVTAGDTMAIAKIDLPTGGLSSLSLDFQDITEETIAKDAFLWSGIAYDAGRLYLAAENYPMIIVVDATSGRVLEAFGIPGAHEFSEIAVSNGQIILPSDHNYFDERPPLLVYQLPT